MTTETVKSSHPPCPYTYSQLTAKDYDKTSLKSYGPLLPILPNQKNSIYTQDYVQWPFKKTDVVVNPLWDGYKDPSPIDYGTIYNHEYVEKKSTVERPMKPEDPQYFLPFNGQTAYRTNFEDWGNQPNFSCKPADQPTLSKNLKFTAKSNYQDNYPKKQSETMPNFKYQTPFKSPFNPECPFLGQTTNQTTYKPFKTGKTSSMKEVPTRDVIPAFKGQFDTQYKQDYNKKCCKHKN